MFLNCLSSRAQQLSTYALTLYKHTATVGDKTVSVGGYRGLVVVVVVVARKANYI